MKFLKKYKSKIFGFSLLITGSGTLFISIVAPEYIRFYFILRYILLFLFIAILGVVIIEFLYDRFKIYFISKNYKLWALNLLSVLVLIFTLFYASTFTLTSANNNVLVQTQCDYYDNYNNLIYKSAISFSCPDFTTERISQNHIKMSSRDTLKKDVVPFYIPRQIYNESLSNVVVDQIDVLTDIDIEYFPDGLIQEYTLTTTIFFHTFDSNNDYLGFISNKKIVENVELDNGFTSTRTNYYLTQTITLNEDQSSLSHPINYGEPVSVKMLEVARTQRIEDQKIEYDVDVLLDGIQVIVGESKYYESYEFTRFNEDEDEVMIYKTKFPDGSSLFDKESKFVYSPSNGQTSKVISGENGGYNVIESKEVDSFYSYKATNYRFVESNNKLIVIGTTKSSLSYLLYSVEDKEYGYRVGCLQKRSKDSHYSDFIDPIYFHIGSEDVDELPFLNYETSLFYSINNLKDFIVKYDPITTLIIGN